MANIPTIYGDDWGMAYYCYTHMLKKYNCIGIQHRYSLFSIPNIVGIHSPYYIWGWRLGTQVSQLFMVKSPFAQPQPMATPSVRIVKSCPAADILALNRITYRQTVFKSPLSLHYIGWFLGVPLLGYYNHI